MFWFMSKQPRVSRVRRLKTAMRSQIANSWMWLLRAGGVHLAPVEISRDDLRVVQIEGVDREDIAIEHDEIPALADLEAAGRLLLLQRRRGVDGIGIDHILQVEALLGQKRALALGRGARDGVLHRDEGVEAADAPIAAADDQGARIAQRARRIEVPGALRPEIGNGRLVDVVIALRPQQL